jgi:hypothetical protein
VLFYAYPGHYLWALGLADLVGYLDYVLLPLLGVFVLLIIVGWYRRKS